MPELGTPYQPTPYAKRIDGHVGANLRERRLKCKLTAVELSQVLEVSEEEYLSWESGKTRVPASKLLEAAQLLSCSAVEFFNGLPDGSRIITR